MGPLEHSTSSCFMKDTWQGWDAQPASQGACCSSQCLRHPPADSGQQGCMFSASRVCNRDRLLFVHSGLPGGASVCWLFPEWDGPMAGAPGVPGHGPSSWARTLRLRERPCVSEGPHHCQVENLGLQPGSTNPRATLISSSLPEMGGSPSSSLAVPQPAGSTCLRSGGVCGVQDRERRQHEAQ